MTNLNSTTDLTEFGPLSPDEKQSGVTSMFSRLFKYTPDGAPDNVSRNRHNVSMSTVEKGECSGNAWKIYNPLDSNKSSASSRSKSDEMYPETHSGLEVRNLPNVLRRVSNILALRKESNDSNLKQYWMPDSVSKECYECGEKFTTFRRRHHCRICGQIFCAQCCNQEVPGKIIRYQGSLRVCTYCCKVVLSYLRDNDLSVDLKAVQDDLLSKFGDGSLTNENNVEENTSNSKMGSSNTAEKNKRKISVVYQEEKFVGSRLMGSFSRNEHSSRKSELSSLNSLLYELTRSENPLQFQELVMNNVKYDSCFTGCQLIDWLISERKTLSRTHSVAIGQVLLDANYIESINHSSADFIDGPVLYRCCLDTMDIKKSSSENESSQFPAENTTRLSHSGFHLDINISKNIAYISRHPTKVINSRDKKKLSASFGSDFTKDVINDFTDKYLRSGEISPTYWASADENNLLEENGEIGAFRSLCDVFRQHIQNTVNQLLALENLSLSWMQIIVPLAEQVLKEIKLDFNKIDIFNIGHYVQIRQLICGERKDSCLIGGVICNKNVVHRDMCSRFANPRILLLQCPIVYQRIEDKLTSLEPVLMQEQEYLRHVVARIATLAPDIVLVHRNVSHLAQELFISYGITLVLNVKVSVMERVARCTNADIITSIDAHIGTTQLGTCRSFYTKEFTLKNGTTKNMMFFEGCAFPQLGCTILLHGASKTELSKLKRVTSSLIFMKYNAKLEKSFLLDEFAKPPSIPSFTLVGDSTYKRPTSFREDIGNIKKAYPQKEVEEKRVPKKSFVNTTDPLNLHFEVMDGVCAKTSENDNKLSFTDIPMKENKFKMALQDTVLSYSPFIVFNLPYLETTAGRTCELRKYFPTEVYYSSQIDHKKGTVRSTNSDCTVSQKQLSYNSVAIKEVHPFVRTKLKDGITNENVQTLLSSYRASGGRLRPNNELTFINTLTPKALLSNTDSKIWEFDFADPRNHQRLSVLFCSFSHYSNNSPEFCVNPWIVNMDFYGCNDIPLGSFLEKYCFRTSYMCPSETCETPMLDHERRFVHDSGCIHVTLNEVESLPDKDNQILFWSVCTVCKIITPIVTLSSDTWNLSFAKYLELRFHAGKYTCRADVARSCHHSLHHDFCQYFYHCNIIASFKYSDILRWEISLPQFVLKFLPMVLQSSDVLDEVKKWSIMGHEVFGSILEKLCSFHGDYIASTNPNLKKQLNKEQAEFKQYVDEIQVLLTTPTFANAGNGDVSPKQSYLLEETVVLMKKKVAKAVSDWNPLLTKLDSKKKDERLKNKSVSSEIPVYDNIVLPNTDEIRHEETSKMKEPKAELNCIEVDDLPSDILSRVKNVTSITTAGNEHLTNSSCNETKGEVTEGQTYDKLSVKALLQLLPHPFQNHPSMLSNPINLEEHYLLNRSCSIPLVVYESEPSSIIAYSLSTHFYQNSLDELVMTNAPSLTDCFHKNVGKTDSSDATASAHSSADLHHQVMEVDELSKYEFLEENKVRSNNKASDTNHIEVGVGVTITDDNIFNIHFSDSIVDSLANSCTNFTVKVYFAQQFKEVRNIVFPAGEESFIHSLSRCVPWAAHGGKSGSYFCKTRDDRFVLKAMSRLEIAPFLEFAPHYFNFIRTCHLNQQPTLLAKIVGVYYVKFRNGITNQTFQLTLLVMENLFYNRDIIRKFDLKGSVRNRLVNTKDGHEGELVLLDENLINMTFVSPLYIYPHSKTVLLQAINNDVSFLASLSVMDYSLLVGLDETSQELVVGIIDYIRTFTWDKKLETMVKKSGILGGQGKLPTIVSPEEYKNRFISAMHKYFLAVPDQWLGFGKGVSY